MAGPTSAAVAHGIRASRGRDIAETKWKGVKSAGVQVDAPFLPAALELFNRRVTSNSKDDPEVRCLPVGVPRYMFDPYAFDHSPAPETSHFPLRRRQLPVANCSPSRGSSQGLKPTWMGDAAGHYEKHTLGVDVTGFNGKAWLDQAGHPQTTQARLTERYTRTDSIQARAGSNPAPQGWLTAPAASGYRFRCPSDASSAPSAPPERRPRCLPSPACWARTEHCSSTEPPLS